MIRLGKDPREHIAEMLLPGVENDRPEVLWVSFSRYWATHHGINLATLPALKDSFKQLENLEEPVSIRERLRSLFFALDIEKKPGAAFHATFGGKPSQDESDTWKIIDTAIDRFFTKRPTARDRCTPWAYVMRVLEALGSRIYKNQFFCLDIRRPAPCVGEPALSCSNPIWLPLKVPAKCEIKEAMKSSDWNNSRSLSENRG